MKYYIKYKKFINIKIAIFIIAINSNLNFLLQNFANKEFVPKFSFYEYENSLSKKYTKSD